jgi:hypothetical protein
MGRKRINKELKKGKLSITISTENNKLLEDGEINKSKLINWLLVEYFNRIN